MKKKKKKYTFRKFINDVHLWLGLISGIILFLVCLSGTILTFEEEIKAAFTEEITVAPDQEQTLPVAVLNEKVKDKGTLLSVSISPEKTTPYAFRIKTSEKDRRGTTFYVDQYTGKVYDQPTSSLDEFFWSMFRLHRWLLLDSSIGRPIVGIATLIFVVLSISGIVLWFPKRLRWKNIKPGFKIKWSANWKRINHDLHNTLGFYACIFIVIMALTGLCWSFAWYRDAGSAVLGAKIFGGRGGGPKVESVAKPASEEKTFEDIYRITGEELPFEGETTVSVPNGPKDTYAITKYHTSGFTPVAADKLVIDRDGSILKKEIFADKPLNVRIVSLIRPIHMGTVFGTFSKIIYFITCLIATSLPITGTIIWINKMKKKK
ncbi:PepSY-associated TM helix domain-containing protein [Sinomicrobium weinanense]|uniref:PepSY domain-containing protein n=1 Tax=Sinomicrobium weinanense TaxID=2842200 RepID=A0A926JQ99_9FLAO|nr:PepSY-associated TM helix domain-containing protein [Sinomicrobium weinanense]MBC9795480.1 PepSY domain-containing protein [Sinomicrobium weinanense]MBU3123373.1 PepSY domain-containing protein [Sinomicrobium weinanense]